MYFFKLLAVVFAVSLLAAPSVFAQSSASSTLEQQIRALECNYTTVETGLGRTHASTCPHFAPTIEIIDTNMGRPIITGIYDAVHTKELRIQVGDVWYVLGVNKELTVYGNVWVLNLSNPQHALPEGDYLIIVETMGDDGELRRGEATMQLVLSGPDSEEPGEPTPDPSGPTPRAPVQDMLHASWLPLGASIIITGLLFFFIILKRRRNEEDEWAEYYAIMHSETSEWLSTTSQQEEQDNTPY